MLGIILISYLIGLWAIGTWVFVIAYRSRGVDDMANSLFLMMELNHIVEPNKKVGDK